MRPFQTIATGGRQAPYPAVRLFYLLCVRYSIFITDDVQRRCNSTLEKDIPYTANSAESEYHQESNLQNAPNPLKTNYTFHLDGTRLDRFNLRLARASKKGAAVEAIELCSSMKRDGVAPNVTTYNYLLESCAQVKLAEASLAIIEDMRMMGLQPDVTSGAHVLQARR